MRKERISIFCLILALALLLGGCGQTANEDAHTGKIDDTIWKEETDIDPEGSAVTSGTSSAEEPEAVLEEQPEWHSLTQEELDSLTDSLDWSENGFFVTSYSRPEEIWWNEVFYNGAGLKRNPSEEELAEYENAVAPAVTSLVCIDRKDIEDFVREKTGTDYSAARHPLQWYVTETDLYMTQHGDTNAIPICFTEGMAAGNEYRLTFMGTDYANYRGERPFTISVRIEDGKWLYRSNLPADMPAPLDLLDIRFVGTEEEAKALGATDFVWVEQLPSDEPFGWCWAVLTAQEDGVRYVAERLRYDTDIEMILSQSFGLRIPDKNLTSGVLNKGESVALWTNRPWTPRIRLTASKGAYFGEYVFGEDNWLYLDDSVPRSVIGHDLAGEGKGCEPKSEVDLVSFLSDGAWEYKDEETGETLAGLLFLDYRTLEVENGSGFYQIYLQFDRIYAGPDEAPDLLKMEKYFEDDYCWDAHSWNFPYKQLGDYLVSAIQLDGEQILTLRQANNGEGILNSILPGADSNQHVFTFHRYIGTLSAEGHG